MKARYQILAMVTDKKALGLSLNNGRPISVEGNPHMYYTGPEDMERFARYIKNEYSINDFDDDDFALIIVDCGADCAAAKSLHAKTLTAKCSSLIEAEYVLPFIAAKKRAIKKGEEFAVTIADAAYTLRADDKGRIDCVRCTADAPPENALSLELADFTALFFADASVFGRDEDALKQKDSEIADGGDVVIFVKSDHAPQIWVWQQDGKECSKEMGLTKENAPFMKRHINGWYAFIVSSKYYEAGKSFSFTLDNGEAHNTALTDSFCYDGNTYAPAFTKVQAEAHPAPGAAQMVFVEGGIIDMPGFEHFNGTQVDSFYMAAAPVTMQEYFDVTKKAPEAILGWYAVKEGLIKAPDIDTAQDVARMSHHDLEAAFYSLRDNCYMETPEIDKAHFERLQAGAAMLLPKAALDGVSAMLRSKYRFLAWEDFEAQAAAAYGKNVPVTHVSVPDQVYFCNQKSKKEGLGEAMAPSNDIIEYTEVTVQEYFNVMGTLPKSLLAYYAIEKRLIKESVVNEYKEESESRYKYSNSGDYSLTVQKLKSLHKKLEDIYLAFREQRYAEKELTEAHWKRLKAGDFVFMPQEAFSRLPADAKEYAVRPWEVFVAKAAQDAGSYWLRRMESNRFSSFEIACCLREDEMRHFCRMLSEKNGVLAVPTAQCNHGRFAYRLLAYERTGKDKAGYYLPSKAEWLYAANGGIDQQRFQYAGSNNLDTCAWYKDNSGGILHPVAQKQPNTIGLYDMCGNVRETVIDKDNIHFDAFGGSAYDDKENCILAHSASPLHAINGQTGFRICANRRLNNPK